MTYASNIKGQTWVNSMIYRPSAQVCPMRKSDSNTFISPNLSPVVTVFLVDVNNIKRCGIRYFYNRLLCITVVFIVVIGFCKFIPIY